MADNFYGNFKKMWVHFDWKCAGMQFRKINIPSCVYTFNFPATPFMNYNKGNLMFGS